jgi:hypothetical protein
MRSRRLKDLLLTLLMVSFLYVEKERTPQTGVGQSGSDVAFVSRMNLGFGVCVTRSRNEIYGASLRVHPLSTDRPGIIKPLEFIRI